ncbi:hypothetical protein JG687_00008547 [Phytophthora cactorum]|uniref:Uncharacterized protein n=2 Tax=Phytophthora cactorum TaxID=29920 RepID=A0A8T1UDJ4_9STRA|nr:hypothetical protein JG687_00008547 [Phytophthora cactorum]
MKLANKEEKERLQSNARLHNGKSTAWSLAVTRPWVRYPAANEHARRRFDGVRVQLLHLIEFHNTIGDVMSLFRTARQERAAERLRDADQCARSRSRSKRSNSRLYLMVIECTHHGYEVLEEVKFAYGIVNKPYETNDEFNARCTYLHELSRKQHDQLVSLALVFLAVAIWYLCFEIKNDRAPKYRLGSDSTQCTAQ